MITRPFGRLVALQYRDFQPKHAVDTSVFVVHFRTPEDEIHEEILGNVVWSLDNRALQFMALYGYQPTALEGTMHNVEDDQILVPIAPDDDGWGLSQAAMVGSRAALEEAEWFDPDVAPNATDEANNGPLGGGSPDPGTGNRGAVDDEDQGGVSAEMAGEDSDAGVNVVVE